MNSIKELYGLQDYDMQRVAEHEGGRNLVCICKKQGKPAYVIRISLTGDRREEEYLAETAFVHYLARGGAPVADVLPSRNGRLVEKLVHDGTETYISLFAYAEGMLISDNGYRYRDGAPLFEYFYNTGKALGRIHHLSRQYVPVHRRPDYFDKYNMDYIGKLIPDTYAELKQAMADRLARFGKLPETDDTYGLVHFDFSDGNYHINMENGDITVFDFDNCMYCWYMFDLANLWTHGVGWCQWEKDPEKRRAYMTDYFDQILSGYRSENGISDALLEKLPLFIDMVLIENIVDEFECCERRGEQIDYEDIRDAAECLIHDISWAGFFL